MMPHTSHMIESTFLFLNGIGRTTERRLWDQGIPTWREFLQQSSIGGISAGRVGWSNKKFDDLVTKADVEPDATKRNALYKQVLQTLADDAANLWVASPVNLAILSKGFQGYQAPGISPSLYLAEAYFA